MTSSIHAFDAPARPVRPGDAAGPPILEVRGLRVSIRGDAGLAQILDHVDLTIPKGKVVGVVGESGCGKSTLIRAVLGILPRGARVEAGAVLFENEDLLRLGERDMTHRIRGSRIGFIPQDPYLAFNPVFTVGKQLLEIMRWHASGDDRSNRSQLVELLRAVQIAQPDEALRRYPHEFSGGQRQRLLIAAALACHPRLVIADEPTTALDVTTQLQILALLKRLIAEFDLSMLFVTHDFGVVAQICDEVTVMYAGQSVEAGETMEVLHRPRHPYTRMLVACHPDRSDELAGIPGSVPSPVNPPSGCRFNTRCPSARPQCLPERPRTVTDPGGHQVNCVLYY